MVCSTPGFPVLQQLTEFAQLMAFESVLPSNYHILCHPLFLNFFPVASGSFLMSWLLHQVAKVLELQLQHQFFQWIFSINFLKKLLRIQRILKSLQHHNLKALILQHSAFSMVLLSNPYLLTGKTIALTILTFDVKELSLLFEYSV